MNTAESKITKPLPPPPRPVPVRPIDLVAIDLDGTLLTTNKKLSVKVVNAVHRVVDKGVHVVLASARPPRSVREVYECLKLQTPLINYNGALILDPIRGRNLYHRPLPSALARRVIKAARKVDPKVVVSLEILDKWYTDFVDETLPTETSKQFMPDFVGPLDAFLHVPVTKLMLLAPPVRMEQVREAIEARFAGQVALAISDEHLLQVVHPEVDKGRALARVAGGLGIPAERVMAIGDAPNDVGMLNWAGLGVAVNNAWDVVRASADVIVPSNDEDGVAFALKRYVLNL